MNKEKKKDNKGSLRRTLIEWGVILGVIGLLYITGWHTQVLGTMQRGLLATGLIKPDIPAETENLPEASREFYFADINGSVSSLNEFEGKAVFLNIWATWCPPCIAEMPSIQALYNDVKENPNVAFVLVSMDEDFEKAKAFMEQRESDLPIYHYRTKAPGTYQSTVIPTTYVISADGKLALEKRGLAKYDTEEFKEFLISLAPSAL